MALLGIAFAEEKAFVVSSYEISVDSEGEAEELDIALENFTKKDMQIAYANVISWNEVNEYVPEEISGLIQSFANKGYPFIHITPLDEEGNYDGTLCVCLTKASTYCYNIIIWK